MEPSVSNTAPDTTVTRPQQRRRTGHTSFTAPTVVRTFNEARYIPPVEELLAELEQIACILIDGGCGLGKSTRIRELLERLVAESPGIRILILSVRVIHALNILADYTTDVLKPTVYLEGDRAGLLQSNFVILSWEQANLLEFAPQFDVVVLDEIRSGLVVW